MVGKFTKAEKIIEILCICMLVIAIVVKLVFIGNYDVSLMIGMGIMAFMMYFIMLVCAFSPAYARMSEKQKSRIKDMDKHQSFYRRCMVIVNLFICLIFSVIILFIV